MKEAESIDEDKLLRERSKVIVKLVLSGLNLLNKEDDDEKEKDFPRFKVSEVFRKPE